MSTTRRQFLLAAAAIAAAPIIPVIPAVAAPRATFDPAGGVDFTVLTVMTEDGPRHFRLPRTVRTFAVSASVDQLWLTGTHVDNRPWQSPRQPLPRTDRSPTITIR